MKTLVATPRIDRVGLFLDINLSGLLPASLEWLGLRWVVKPEFHVTLLTPGNLISLDGLQLSGSMPHALDDAQRKAEGEKRAALFKEKTVPLMAKFRFEVMVVPSIHYVRKDYRPVHDETRYTVIALCLVPGAAEFYRRFEAETGCQCVYPPHHVTLYTAEDEASRRGIGIYSFESMSSCATEKFKIPDALKVF